ncbi:FtsK/SpoIIIE domain-containing protein [Streptomyces sp. NPDC048324]|uniref:FtsK/SpoIIIE domain-containing protein n=1 Tax=Streptomyces sp. NPDC048324 TaxID=3157205 RepID=UPI0034477213
MGKKRTRHEDTQEDIYGQSAGAIGGLVIVLGGLYAIKDKTGLPWPAAVILTGGVLVGLGYVAWRVKAEIKRRWATEPAKAPSEAPAQESPSESADDAETAAPVHPELTAALTRTGAIGRDEVILASDVQTKELAGGLGTQYTFLLPKSRTHEHVGKQLGPIASMFGVTRLHLKLETSRQNEREIKLLKLHEPPFTRPFTAPTRQEIETFAGIPIGHDVTGELAGLPTFEKASLLVAGMTQMGKTTLVNGLITCLLIAYGDFELYLLDGKFCGLTRFESIATRYESSDDPSVFWSMVQELNERADGRYAEIQEAIRNRQPVPTFKPVIFIVDEAADFFAPGATNEEKDRARKIADDTRSLVAKSLESGISSVIMTQRPSVNAIPVEVRDQFLYRVCLYVASSGTAKVALGDTYFETIAPINPALLDAKIKGQAVLFVNGESTLIRGFNFSDNFIWEVVDGIQAQKKAQQQVRLEKAPDSPLKQAIELMQDKELEFITSADLAPFLGVMETDATERGKKLAKLLGVPAGKGAKGARGYHLAALTAAAMPDS